MAIALPVFVRAPEVGKVTLVVAVVVNVKELPPEVINELPSARVKVADVAGAVTATLLTDVADATPNTGVTRVGDVASTTAPLPVEVVAPVPPLVTAKVPAKVIVPAPVTGPPDVVSPVVPPETSTEVTVPVVGEKKLKAPLPFVARTCPFVPSEVGNV